MTEQSSDSPHKKIEALMEADSQKFITDFEKITGMSFVDMEAIRTTFGEEMKNGSVHFVPSDGKDGVFGSLWHPGYGEDTDQREHQITSPDEAAFLLGLQIEADKQKS